jgi:hypothetical protein
MRVVLASLAYFGIVFTVGAICGPVRVLWLEPLVGVGLATVAEAPFLLAAMVWAALRLPVQFGIVAVWKRLLMGAAAAVFVILTDATIGRWLRGIALSDQAAALMTPAGQVYLALLLVFALMPFALGGRRSEHAE